MSNVKIHDSIKSEAIVKESLLDDQQVVDDVEDTVHDDAIVELNQFVFLNSSKLSVKQRKSSSIRSKSNYKHDTSTEIFDKLPFKGCILAILSSCFTAVSGIIIKHTKLLSGSDNGVIRFFIQFIVMYALVRYNKANPLGEKKERKTLLLRSIFGTIGLLSILFSIKFLNPSDATSITHTSVIITAILSRIVLKEKISIIHIFATILTISGVIFIVKPKALFQPFMTSTINTTLLNNQTFNNRNKTENADLYLVIGISLALVAAIAVAFVRILLKKLCTNKVHFSITTIYTTYTGLPAALLISLTLTLTGVSHGNFINNWKLLPIEILYSIFAALISLLGQIAFNNSLKYEDASKVAVFKTFDVLVAFILQYLLLGINVDIFSIFGSFLIIMGTLVIILFKIIEDKIKSNKKCFDNQQDDCQKCILFKF